MIPKNIPKKIEIQSIRLNFHSFELRELVRPPLKVLK